MEVIKEDEETSKGASSDIPPTPNGQSADKNAGRCDGGGGGEEASIGASSGGGCGKSSMGAGSGNIPSPNGQSAGENAGGGDGGGGGAKMRTFLKRKLLMRDIDELEALAKPTGKTSNESKDEELPAATSTEEAVVVPGGKDENEVLHDNVDVALASLICGAAQHLRDAVQSSNSTSINEVAQRNAAIHNYAHENKQKISACPEATHKLETFNRTVEEAQKFFDGGVTGHSRDGLLLDINELYLLTRPAEQSGEEGKGEKMTRKEKARKRREEAAGATKDNVGDDNEVAKDDVDDEEDLYENVDVALRSLIWSVTQHLRDAVHTCTLESIHAVNQQNTAIQDYVREHNNKVAESPDATKMLEMLNRIVQEAEAIFDDRRAQIKKNRVARNEKKAAKKERKRKRAAEAGAEIGRPGERKSAAKKQTKRKGSIPEHDRERFKCKECGKTFKKEQGLNQHYKAVHASSPHTSRKKPKRMVQLLAQDAPHA